MNGKQIIKEEFCARFVACMLEEAGFKRFRNKDGSDAGSVEDYANETALVYWNNPYSKSEGPEKCARADMNYWGE